jgi:aminopeptidase N
VGRKQVAFVILALLLAACQPQVDATPPASTVTAVATPTAIPLFSQAANDQALEPWLDESLSTYSELIFYESQYPDLVPWWWSYRINFFEPSGYIDIPVYQGQNDDIYKRIVYFNGTHFLRDLRSRIGDEAFYAFLKDYYAQEKDQIATNEDFFRILDVHTDEDYSDIVRGYFRNR